MDLTGYERRCAKRPGGIGSLLLAEVSDIETVVYDVSERVFTSVSLADGVSFVKYDFREDTCGFAETVTRSGGVASVRHEITFTLPGNDAAARAAVSAISAAENGLVAIAVTCEGEAFLVGYSHLFGGERPLRLASSKSATGLKPSDAPGNSVTLASEDTCLACLYTGSLPG